MELIVAVVLFVALVVTWLVLPAKSAEPVAAPSAPSVAVGEAGRAA